MKKIIVVTGLPGVGKSTIAEALSKKLNAVLIQSDVIRNYLFPEETKPSEGKQELYSKDQGIIKYRCVALMAEYAIKSGVSNVIIDTAYSKTENRDLIKSAAKRANAELHVIYCSCADDVVKERIKSRLAKQPSTKYKIADFELYLKMKEAYAPFEKDDNVLEVDSGFPISEAPNVADYIANKIFSCNVNKYKGKYVVFEGTSGSGKDTQLELIKKWLEQNNHRVEILHEPTDFLRPVIKDTWKKGIKNVLVDIFLFAADRAHAVETFLKPKLASGAIILSSRNFVSSLAYQSTCEGAPPIEKIKEINSFVPLPDLILIFDVPPEVAIKRIKDRFDSDGKEISRFEQLNKITELRESYKRIPTILPNCKIINGDRPVNVIFEDVKKIIEKLLTLSE